MKRRHRTGRTTLLDTNVWRYVSDADAGASLARAARAGGRRIVIAPVVLMETMRLEDRELRSALVELMTRRDWKRPMPEAHDECEELLSEVARLHPEWILSPRRSQERVKLAYDWRRPEGGFWSRARSETGREAAIVQILDAGLLTRARSEARTRRRASMEAGWQFDKVTVDAFRAQVVDTRTETGMAEAAPWRVTAMQATTSQLRRTPDGDTARQWLSSRLDLRVVDPRYGPWRRFWLEEVEAVRMPRHWLRGAAELLQSLRKTNAGTPCDAQLATYLPGVDEFVTADRLLHEVIVRCAAEAPFPVATSHLIGAGPEGVRDLVERVETKFVGHRRGTRR